MQSCNYILFLRIENFAVINYKDQLNVRKNLDLCFNYCVDILLINSLRHLYQLSTAKNVDAYSCSSYRAIPDQGNTAEIILTVLHRNFLSVDEFLGRTVIPLNELDIYERPRNRWYSLKSKPGKENNSKNRGELEIKIAFTVKSGSLTDLSKKEKHKSSIGHLSHMAQSVGGSLLSITSIEKRKGIKKFAKSVGSKMHLKVKKNDEQNEDRSSLESVYSLKERGNHDSSTFINKQTREDADPGVVSDDDDFTFDDLSHKSSQSSLNKIAGYPGTLASSMTSLENMEKMRKKFNGNMPPAKSPQAEQKITCDEWELKLYGNKLKNLHKPNGDTVNRKSWESPKLSNRIEEESSQSQLEFLKKTGEQKILPQLAKNEERENMLCMLKKIRKDKHEPLLNPTLCNSNERIIIGGENDTKITTHNRISNEILQKYDGKSREDLILLLCDFQSEVELYRKKMEDLEDYLDELLLRVMETTPRILQNPYVDCKITN